MIFSYQFLLDKYKIVPNGIIHIGAHNAEEAPIYSSGNTENVLWIEGNPELIQTIKNNISAYPNNQMYQALLTDSDDKLINFKITNASMSSSILDLGTHKDQYPNIKVAKELKLYTKRFETFVKENKIDTTKYDFVNLDIQGAELLALRGFGTLLKNINYIYTEINIEHLYKKCALLDEIDEFLLKNGFNRVELSLEYKNWGDAFYIREEITEDQKQEKINESRSLIRNFKPTEKKNQKSILKKILSKSIHIFK